MGSSWCQTAQRWSTRWAPFEARLSPELHDRGRIRVSTTGADGPFTYDSGTPSSVGYRVKFVQGAESVYPVAPLRILTPGWSAEQRFEVHLPLLSRSSGYGERCP